MPEIDAARMRSVTSPVSLDPDSSVSLEAAHRRTKSFGGHSGRQEEMKLKAQQEAERLSREYAEEVSADELEQNTKDEFTTAVHDEKPTENSFYDRTLSESPTQRRKGSMARRTSLNATPTSTGNGIGEGIYGDWVNVASGIVEEATMTAQEVAEEAAAKAERLAAFIASLGDEYVDPDPDAGLTLMEITAKRLDESDKDWIYAKKPPKKSKDGDEPEEGPSKEDYLRDAVAKAKEGIDTLKGQQDIDAGILADKLGVMAKKEEEYQELISEPKTELEGIIKEHEEAALKGDHQCVELRAKIQANHKRFGFVIAFFEALDKKKEHAVALGKAKEALATLNDALATGKKEEEVVVEEAAPVHKRGDSEVKNTDILDNNTTVILEGAVEMHDSDDEEGDDPGHVRVASGVSSAVSSAPDEAALDFDAALDDIEAEAETMAEMETEAIDEQYDDEGDTDGESDEEDYGRTNTKTVTRVIVTGQDYNYEDEVEEDDEEEDGDKVDEEEFETAADEPESAASEGGTAASEGGAAEAAKEDLEGSEASDEDYTSERVAVPNTKHEKLFHQAELLLSELFELEYSFHDDDVDDQAIQRIAARVMREASGERTSVEIELAKKVFEDGPPAVLEKRIEPASAEESDETEGEKAAEEAAVEKEGEEATDTAADAGGAEGEEEEKEADDGAAEVAAEGEGEVSGEGEAAEETKEVEEEVDEEGWDVVFMKERPEDIQKLDSFEWPETEEDGENMPLKYTVMEEVPPAEEDDPEELAEAVAAKGKSRYYNVEDNFHKVVADRPKPPPPTPVRGVTLLRNVLRVSTEELSKKWIDAEKRARKETEEVKMLKADEALQSAFLHLLEKHHDQAAAAQREGLKLAVQVEIGLREQIEAHIDEMLEQLAEHDERTKELRDELAGMAAERAEVLTEDEADLKKHTDWISETYLVKFKLEVRVAEAALKLVDPTWKPNAGLDKMGKESYKYAEAALASIKCDGEGDLPKRVEVPQAQKFNQQRAEMRLLLARAEHKQGICYRKRRNEYERKAEKHAYAGMILHSEDNGGGVKNQTYAELAVMSSQMALASGDDKRGGGFASDAISYLEEENTKKKKKYGPFSKQMLPKLYCLLAGCLCRSGSAHYAQAEEAARKGLTIAPTVAKSSNFLGTFFGVPANEMPWGTFIQNEVVEPEKGAPPPQLPTLTMLELHRWSAASKFRQGKHAEAKTEALAALKVALGDDLEKEISLRGTDAFDVSDNWTQNRVNDDFKECLLDCYRVVAVANFDEKDWQGCIDVSQAALDHVGRRHYKGASKIEKEIVSALTWHLNTAKVANAAVAHDDHQGWTYPGVGWVEVLE
mmetsp:Transcript_17621/g.46010  ORF Transcript_17621/g.46010 Transcript_17621/m.46010 type:complete len:1339 (-) Transcript_17621:1204-5220(-)